MPFELGLNCRVSFRKRRLCLLGADLRVCHRACGGNDVLHVFKGAKAGVSPRVRGNPSVTVSANRHQRSIPARTGEPSTSIAVISRNMVYPRAYGGTLLFCGCPPPIAGLSPRVRANPYRHGERDASHRSIPARMGEPLADLPATRYDQVDPRAYGGTRASPIDAGRRMRPIPARTGNPTHGRRIFTEFVAFK